MHIPVMDKIDGLGTSRAMALSKYSTLERGFARNPELHDRDQQEMKALLGASLLRLAEESRGSLLLAASSSLEEGPNSI